MNSGFRAFLLCIIFIFGSSVSAQHYDPPGGILARAGFTIEKKTITEREISALILYADADVNEKKPVVILIHGGAMPDVSSKNGVQSYAIWFAEDKFDTPYTLAEAGILVVIIDAWWAGQREKPEYRAVVRENYLDSVVRGYVETAKDIPYIIDYLETREDADATRVGSTGRSGGAIISLMAAASEPRLKAVTSWVGCADMIEMAKTKGITGKFLKRFIDTSENLTENLEAFDPVNNAEKMAPTAILLINNRTDPAIPINLAEALHDQLRPYYIDYPERLEIRVRDTAEPTHNMTEQDYDEGCAWLVKFLTE